ncbi:MAG: OadG family transporter subunit [Acidaminococcaceae bacterium]|nr:OadG family transporter subunit [Acidaminococcaceae bacterium]MDD4722842.1 OadG family transporter subunit [Acidaminococcaceae bacterium]
MGPVTTNPWLIAIINMTIVFGVLIVLGIVMFVIRACDPTAKKKPAAKVAVSTPSVAAPVIAKKDDAEIIAVIAAAVAACGCSAEQVACIRRISSPGWTINAREEVMSARKECF